MAIQRSRKSTSHLREEQPLPNWRQPPARRRNRWRRNKAIAMRLGTGMALSPLWIARLFRRAVISLFRRPSAEEIAANLPRHARAAAAPPRAFPRLLLNWRTWVVILLLGLVGFVLVELMTDYQYYVYSADIQGNQRVPADTIYHVAGIDQKSIFWVRPQQVAERIQALPGIGAATVRVRFPNQVSIAVQEREPLIAWEAAGETIWIATDGTPLPQVGAPPPLRLMDTDAAAAGEENHLRPELLAAILALHGQRPDLDELYFGATEGLSFHAPEGWLVYLGSQGDVAGKLAMLQALRPQIAAQAVAPKVIDLRLDGKAYLR